MIRDEVIRDGVLGTCTSVHFKVLVLVLVLKCGVLVPIKKFNC